MGLFSRFRRKKDNNIMYEEDLFEEEYDDEDEEYDDEDEGERISLEEAAQIWSQSGDDEDMFGYTEEELRNELEGRTSSSYYDAFEDEEFESEEEYFRSCKREDSYHFSIEFDYVKKNHGTDNEEWATATMEIDLVWDDSIPRYVISHYVPDMDLIDPNEGNGDENEFYEYFVKDKLEELLEEEDIALGAVENL